MLLGLGHSPHELSPRTERHRSPIYKVLEQKGPSGDSGPAASMEAQSLRKTGAMREKRSEARIFKKVSFHKARRDCALEDFSEPFMCSMTLEKGGET